MLAGLRVEWAANHDELAMLHHELAHPDAMHVPQDLWETRWSDLPEHDGLIASPCCQGHCDARGPERPWHDTSRGTANALIRYMRHNRPAFFVVENVPEFMRWHRFPGWRDAMRRCGFTLSTYVLDAADFGVPQHRERLFIVGTRSRSPIQLHFERRPHVPVSAILDPDDIGRWSRIDKPRRAARTLAQIARGRAEIGDRFLIPYYGSGSGLTGRATNRPLGTVTTVARYGFVDAARNRMRMLSVAEYRRAMSFRDDYPLPRQQAAAIKLLGNAVCPKQGAVVLSRVLEAL